MRRTTPPSYPDHGNGLFFVGLENNGSVYAYALNHADNTYTRVAIFASGFTSVHGAGLGEGDPEALGGLRRHVRRVARPLRVDTAAGPTQGTFVARTYYERPAGHAEPQQRGLHDHAARRVRRRASSRSSGPTTPPPAATPSVRHAELHAAPTAQTVTFTTTKPASAVVGQTYAATATGGASGNPVVISVTPSPAGACTIAGGTVTFKHPGHLRGEGRPGRHRRLPRRRGPASRSRQPRRPPRPARSR